MKKVVLAKLTPEECDELQMTECNCSTFKTLLSNQFVSEEERRDIMEHFREHLSKSELIYNNISKKYNIPYLHGMKYKVSPETNELFIEIYE